MTILFCDNSKVSDLSPLKDMKLTLFDCQNTSVSDLSPLKGMKLTYLGCSSQVSDLSLLKVMPPIENPELFTAYVVGPPVPGDNNKMFLTLVYAEIERRWNKTPPFEIEPPAPKKKHGGKKYQDRCLEVLRWLHAEGDITNLVVSEGS